MIQAIFRDDQAQIDRFKHAISPQRFGTYLGFGEGDELMAIRLYQWNTQLSRSLHVYLHGWEICLPNKLNAFLTWKYGTSEWAFNDRCLRQIPQKDRRKVEEAIERQKQARGSGHITTASVVADLSAGVWVSMLSSACEVPFGMRGTPGGNLYRIFPNVRNVTRQDYWQKCDNILSIRNRVAHYEPVLRLNLKERHEDIQHVVGAMCATTRAFFDATCDFRSVLDARPVSDSVAVAVEIDT